jgi:hypothetical protein
VNHALVGVALQEVVRHHRRLFKVAGEVAQTVTGRLRNVITPGYRNRTDNVRIQYVIVEAVHGAVKPFKRIRTPLLLSGTGTPHKQSGAQRKRR